MPLLPDDVVGLNKYVRRDIELHVDLLDHSQGQGTLPVRHLRRTRAGTEHFSKARLTRTKLIKNVFDRLDRIGIFNGPVLYLCGFAGGLRRGRVQMPALDQRAQ